MIIIVFALFPLASGSQRYTFSSISLGQTRPPRPPWLAAWRISNHRSLGRPWVRLPSELMLRARSVSSIVQHCMWHGRTIEDRTRASCQVSEPPHGVSDVAVPSPVDARLSNVAFASLRRGVVDRASQWYASIHMHKALRGGRPSCKFWTWAGVASCGHTSLQSFGATLVTWCDFLTK